ncbi:MAG: tetratricopeptide repeat protein [Candidatus Omnitrophota bacterium]
MTKYLRMSLVFAVAVAIAYAASTVFDSTQSFYMNFATAERYFKAGDYNAALRYFEIARAIKPDDDKPAPYLLWIYFNLDMKERAAGMLEELLAKDPTDGKLLTQYADVCYSLNNLPRAEELYRRASAVSKDPAIKRRLAEVLTWQRKYDEAIPLLKELYDKDPSDRELALVYAQALGYGRYPEDAIKVFSSLERKYPGDMKIKYLFAIVLESNGSFKAARKRYAELLSNEPGNFALKMKVARLSAWAKDYPEAVRLYKELLASRPHDVAVTAELADVLFWSADYEGAADLYAGLTLSYAKDKERLKNLGYCYLALKRYDAASELFKRLQKAYPSDESIQLALADTLFGGGKLAEAETEYSALLSRNPSDIEVMKRLSQLLGSGRKYGDAAALLKKIIAAEPDNTEALWWLARILSWDRRYKEALAEYDKLIAKDPSKTMPRREKARILGWMRRYMDSIAEYRKIQDEAARDEAAALEMSAKEALYKRFDAEAIKAYGKWLDKEPADLEALFDLAQVYSRNGRWDDARSQYGEVLEVFPSHFRAKEALAKVELLSKCKEVSGGFEYFEQDSTSRDTDEKYYDVYTKFRAPLMKDLYLTVREDTFIHEFSDISSVTREKAGAGLELTKMPFFRAKAELYASMYNKGYKDNLNSNEEAELKPAGWLLLAFSHLRDDVLDNSETLRHSLKKDDIKGRVQFDPNRRISLGGDFMYTDLSDGNDKDTFGLDAKAQLFYEPRSLSLKYRYEQYNYDRSGGYYFSPGSFHYNSVSLEWRHFLNKEELFWGSNDTYYTLRYTANFEVNDNIGNVFYAGLCKDWNDRFSTRAEWSKTVYNHRKVYRADRVMVYASYKF